MAVFNLPKGMLGFYIAHADYLAQHSTDPDRRRYVDSTEGAKHFFNADCYGKTPFKTVPQRWAEAERRYSADSLQKHGILPWAIQRSYYKLVDAFKTRDTAYILTASVYLAHYVADACVPLHTTQNHNGQLSNQLGIHGFWETRVPELLGNSYEFKPSRVKYIESPLAEAWRICADSYRRVDSVLTMEQKLNTSFSPSDKYTPIKRNGKLVNDYSEAYTIAYNKALNNMAQKQMRKAVALTANFWYTAWVDAGQPNLSQLNKLNHTDSLALQQNQSLYQQYRKGSYKL